MTPVLQRHIPHLPWMDAQTLRLPGTKPLNLADWLVVDEAYAGQMALRDQLIANHPEAVHAVLPQAKAAAREVYDLILPLLPSLGFDVQAAHVVRPDGVTVPLDLDTPLLTLGRLVQEDLCIMQEDGQGEHLLSAAILCFPAGWMLAEKLGRPMMRIHQPVTKYTDDVGRRVQRLMDMVRTDAPLWRANAHHSDAPLHNPLSEVASHKGYRAVPVAVTDKPFIRSERQALIRLPHSGAVLFSIHT
ncbi:MAG: heme-dependent oxidative N-demethylase family protein, partial [Paracoccaceae bacterium]